MSWALSWNGQRVGLVDELSADMYWWHARWRPDAGAHTETFLASVEAGDDPRVALESEPPRHFVVTAASEHELELKAAAEP